MLWTEGWHSFPISLGMVSLAFGIWTVQWWLSARLPQPVAPWLRAVAFIVVCLSGGNALLSLQHGPTDEKLTHWLLASSALLVLSLAIPHALAVRKVIQGTIATSDERTIEEKILRQSLVQIKTHLELKNDLDLAKQKQLRAQMNPHFLFNVLTGIQHLVMREENEQASRMFRCFRQLLTQGSWNSGEPFTLLSEELQQLENYIELEEMRMTQPVKWRVDMEEGIDPEQIKVPPFLIQPLIENAIWHGLEGGNKKNSAILLVISRQLNDLIIQVHDNGGGMALDLKSDSLHQSRGTGLIRERLNLLPNGGNLDIRNRRDPTMAIQGVTSEIRLLGWIKSPH